MFRNLEAEQRRLGMTNSDVAELLGVSRSTYESKKKNGMFNLCGFGVLVVNAGIGLPERFGIEPARLHHGPADDMFPSLQGIRPNLIHVGLDLVLNGADFGGQFVSHFPQLYKLLNFFRSLCLLMVSSPFICKNKTGACFLWRQSRPCVFPSRVPFIVYIRHCLPCS